MSKNPKTTKKPTASKAVRCLVDEATDAIAVPYLSHVKRVE